MKAELIDIIEVGNTLGESVTWDPRCGHLWWTDIQERKIYSLDYASRNIDIYSPPERLGSFGLTDDPEQLICAFASGFALYNPSTQLYQSIGTVEPEFSGTRLNDGRLDRQGRFFAGTMIENNERSPANKCGLYSVDSGMVQQHFKGLTIANGLSWSTNGSLVYVADTAKQTIWRFDYDVNTGQLSNRRIFANTKGKCYPDGATVDSSDHYWSANWGAARLIRYTPDGQVDFELSIDAPNISCVELGGPDMNLLFVSSARQGLSAEQLAAFPNSGHLFVYKTDIKGIAQKHFYSAND